MKNYIKTLEKEIKTSEKYQRHPEQLESPEHESGYCDGLKFALDEWKKHDTAAAIRRAIREFVRNEYGEAEAQIPSWDIRALAQAITDTLKGGDNE